MKGLDAPLVFILLFSEIFVQKLDKNIERKNIVLSDSDDRTDIGNKNKKCRKQEDELEFSRKCHKREKCNQERCGERKQNGFPRQPSQRNAEFCARFR